MPQPVPLTASHYGTNHWGVASSAEAARGEQREQAQRELEQQLRAAQQELQASHRTGGRVIQLLLSIFLYVKH